MPVDLAVRMALGHGDRGRMLGGLRLVAAGLRGGLVGRLGAGWATTAAENTPPGCPSSLPSSRFPRRSETPTPAPGTSVASLIMSNSFVLLGIAVAQGQCHGEGGRVVGGRAEADQLVVGGPQLPVATGGPDGCSRNSGGRPPWWG